MKAFGMLVLLLALVVGVGFYRGWFSVSRKNQNPENHKVDVSLTLDPDRIEADADAVKDKAQELTDEAKEKANQLVPPVADPSDSK